MNEAWARFEIIDEIIQECRGPVDISVPHIVFHFRGSVDMKYTPYVSLIRGPIDSILPTILEDHLTKYDPTTKYTPSFPSLENKLIKSIPRIFSPLKDQLT